MRKILILIAFAVGVAATPAHAGYGDDGYGGLLQTLSQYYNSLKQSIAEIATTTGSMTTKLDARCTNLEQGLLNLTRGLQGDIDALEQEAAKWMDYSPTDFVLSSELDSEIESGISRSSSVTKSSDFNSYKSTVETTYAKLTELQEVQQNVQDAIDLAREAVDAIKQKLDKTEAESKYATKETTNSHETRITALENHPGGGGGGGCDDNCRESWQSVYNFFGNDVATIVNAQSTGSCHRVTLTGTAIDWLNNLPIAYVGSDFSYGIEAQSMWDDDLKPTFPVSEDWAGSGLAVDDNGSLKVSVGGSVASGTLGGTLNGVNETDAEGLVAYDADGNICSLQIGLLGMGIPDFETIILEENQNGHNVIKVNTEGICDLNTIDLDENNLLKVEVNKIVDGISIVADGNGDLALKRDGDTIAVSEAGARVDTSKLCDGSTIKVDDDGKLCSTLTTVVTNTISAGAGILLTENGGGHITISALDFGNAPSDDNAIKSSVEVITDIRYDEDEHKFQVKRRTITYTGTITEDPEDWEDIFTATSHKGEHDDDK